MFFYKVNLRINVNYVRKNVFEKPKTNKRLCHPARDAGPFGGTDYFYKVNILKQQDTDLLFIPSHQHNKTYYSCHQKVFAKFNALSLRKILKQVQNDRYVLIC